MSGIKEFQELTRLQDRMEELSELVAAGHTQFQKELDSMPEKVDEAHQKYLDVLEYETQLEILGIL